MTLDKWMDQLDKLALSEVENNIYNVLEASLQDRNRLPLGELR
jgi:hypothetical protein